MFHQPARCSFYLRRGGLTSHVPSDGASGLLPSAPDGPETWKNLCRHVGWRIHDTQPTLGVVRISPKKRLCLLATWQTVSYYSPLRRGWVLLEDDTTVWFASQYEKQTNHMRGTGLSSWGNGFQTWFESVATEATCTQIIHGIGIPQIIHGIGILTIYIYIYTHAFYPIKVTRPWR